MRYGITLGIGALLGLLAAAPVAAQRVLIDAPGLAATLDGALRCPEPARLTIHAQQPEVFDGESPELQRLLDAVHAMLAFECPDLDEIQVQGMLKGLDEPVLRGTAGRNTDWMLRAEQTIRSGTPMAPPAAGAAPGAAGSPGPGADGLTVAGLFPGMTVEEATSAVADTFGVAPDYDPKRGVLTMHTQGCPRGYPWDNKAPAPQAGWKCLKAWFTDQRLARLYLLQLVQVVEGDNLGAVETALTERFGETEKRRGDRGEIHLGWGPTVNGDAGAPGGIAPPRRELEAVIEPLDRVIVTTVTRYDPSIASGASDGSGDKVDLKL